MGALRSSITLAFAALLVCAGSAQAASVYATAQANGLTTFLLGVDAAGLKKTLSSPVWQGTVFGPTNEAIATALAGLGLTPAQFLANKPLVTAVINYHIIPDDKLTKKTLSALQTWGTNLDGKDIAIYKNPASTLRLYFGNVKASGSALTWAGSALVVKADVKADNAVLQVINRVLIPSA